MLNFLSRFILFLALVSFSSISRAQLVVCVDSLSRQPTAPCPTNDFLPVCGCDGKTYRNTCDAQLRHGIRTWRDGSCTGFEFDILPNLVTDEIIFTLSQTAAQNFVRLFIVDSFGRLWYQMEIPAAVSYSYTITEVQQFSYGVYFIFLYDTQGRYRYKRFVKIQG